jgi:hypothetical protein
MKVYLAGLAVALIAVTGCGKKEATTAPEAAPAAAMESALMDVDSTVFSKVGYDAAKRELTVVFREGGETYVYANVPAAAYKEMTEAPSMGTYYHENIKDNFEHTKQY